MNEKAAAPPWPFVFCSIKLKGPNPALSFKKTEVLRLRFVALEVARKNLLNNVLDVGEEEAV